MEHEASPQPTRDNPHQEFTWDELEPLPDELVEPTGWQQLDWDELTTIDELPDEDWDPDEADDLPD